MTRGSGILRQFGNRVEQQILMAHHHHRQVTAKEFADLPSIIPRRIHHVFTADLALGGRDQPCVAIPPHPGRRAKPFNPRAHLTCALGQSLSQLCGVNVAVIGVVERAGQLVGFQERVE